MLKEPLVASIALLQTASSPTVGSSYSFFLIGMLALMYIFLFVPQMRQRKKHREMVKTLKKGDQVVTVGGLVGEITGVKDDTVQLKCGGSTLVVERDRVARRTGGDAAPAEATAK
jgi:preprotein translocase subunit YajC